MAGGGIGGGDPDQPLSEINVTPLVDVMLVLLVIFIVAAPLMAQALRVDLPQAEAPPSTEPKVQDLSIRADGTLALGQTIMSKDAVAAALKDAVTQTPELVLRINGDGAVAYEHVAQVLALARAQGISRIAFATTPPR